MQKKEKDEKKIPLEGRDELNLAEYPITLLSHKRSAGVNTIEINDTIEGEPGKPLQRKWTVTSPDIFGLPLAQDNDILLALMAIGKENNFTSPKIHFSSGSLLEMMGWGRSGRAYKKMKEGMKRLKAVSIHAENALYDKEKKGYYTIGFGIIEAYFLFDEPGRRKLQDTLPFSYVTINSVLFASLQNGNIKSLDTKFYFKLESSITKKLYRYLDKKAYRNNVFTINLFKLAYNRLGFDDEVYKYASKIKEKLDPAHEELVKAGFLKSAIYQKTADGTSDKVVYTFTDKKPKKISVPKQPAKKKDISTLSNEELCKLYQSTT
jgi:plasmid replication initiation protein